MVGALDKMRAKLLKLSLQTTWLSRLFYSRSSRLLFLSAVVFAVYLPTSLYFPLWVLLIGPILWGVPHLISSIRYTAPKSSEKINEQIKKLHFSMWAAVFLYRFSIDVLHMPLALSQIPLLFESLVLIFVFIAQVYLLKKLTAHTFIFFSAFCLLTMLTYISPLVTAACLLIAHNFIGLFYWMNSCRSRNDFNTFAIFSFVYGLISIGIITGQFDILFKLYNAQGEIKFLNWNYADLISGFVGASYDYKFWYRFVCLYAFTQAVHYFIWLKAIPETNLPEQHPPSFRWSINKLTAEFGSGSVLMMLALIIVSGSAWLIYEFQTARIIYLGLASYHGFMEIAGLPFMKTNKIQ